jgi:hypothetical protein
LANFNLASQVFTIVYAILDLFRTFVTNPLNRQIHKARAEGLQFVERMSDDLGSPVKPAMILIGDDDDE